MCEILRYFVFLATTGFFDNNSGFISVEEKEFRVKREKEIES